LLGGLSRARGAAWGEFLRLRELGPASQLAIDGRNVDAAAPLGGTIEFGSADLTAGRHIFTFQLAAVATG